MDDELVRLMASCVLGGQLTKTDRQEVLGGQGALDGVNVLADILGRPRHR